MTFDTNIGRLGGLICFENHMTLLKAAMASKGEEIHAACWPGYWSYGGKHNVREVAAELKRTTHSVYSSLRHLRVKLLMCIDQQMGEGS